MTTRPVNRREITAAAIALRARDRPVCVHSSLRSFGRVDGGADAVIDGLLDAGATVLVPTSSFRFCMAPKPRDAPELPFNSEDDGSIPDALPEHGYDRSASFVDPAMGVIPRTALRRDGRVRGDHPLNSFTALGPQAAELVAGQTREDVYAPLRELSARGGLVVCMGVDLRAATIVHLGESLAGLRLLRRWAMLADGTIVEAVHGGCSRGFQRLAPAVAGTETDIRVGKSVWSAYEARALVAAAVERLREDPGAGTCAVPGCPRCRDQLRYAAATHP